jgi:hypothetical protein
MGVLVDMQYGISRTFVSLMLALSRLPLSDPLSSQRIWASDLRPQKLSTLCRYFLVPYAKSADIANETLSPRSPGNSDRSWQQLTSDIEIDVDAPFQHLIRDVANSEGTGIVSIVNNLAPRCEVKLPRHSGIRHRRGTSPPL